MNLDAKAAESDLTRAAIAGAGLAWGCRRGAGSPDVAGGGRPCGPGAFELDDREDALRNVPRCTRDWIFF